MTKILFILLFAVPAFGVGSVVVTRASNPQGEKITVSWVGDSSDGSVPEKAIPIHGRVVKAVTNPGSTAPTANYDIALEDPNDNALDALSAAIGNRHTSTSEQVYPMIAGAPGTVTAVAPYLAGSYNFSLSNNSANSATGDLVLYILR